MVTPSPIPAGEYVPTADQRIVTYGGSDQTRELPDIAIEVIWTSGGIDKLEIYRRLGVGEVWFWKAGRIDVHVLRGEQYERADRSAIFPEPGF